MLCLWLESPVIQHEFLCYECGIAVRPREQLNSNRMDQVPTMSFRRNLLLSEWNRTFSIRLRSGPPATCYAILPPEGDILYEDWVFRNVGFYCVHCFALSTTITPQMFHDANLHYLLCSTFHEIESSHPLTWSSILTPGDLIHQVYIDNIRPFITRLPELYVVHITNPRRFTDWEALTKQRRFLSGNFFRSMKPSWCTGNADNICRSAGGKSAQACILRQSILMPLLHKFPDNSNDYIMRCGEIVRDQCKTTSYLIAEFIIEFLLGPGPCFRPWHTIATLRSKGYISGTSQLHSASLAVWDAHRGRYIWNNRVPVSARTGQDASACKVGPCFLRSVVVSFVITFSTL